MTIFAHLSEIRSWPSGEAFEQTLGMAELDELKIKALRSCPDQEAADILTSRLNGLERNYKRQFIERGLILLEVEERSLWKLRLSHETGAAYHSFPSWVVGEATHSRSDCFAALAAIKAMREVPMEQLLQVPRCNIKILTKLSTKDRTRSVKVNGKNMPVIEAAAVLTENEFATAISEDLPNAHIESKGPMILRPDLSQRKMIEEGLNAAMWYFDVFNREDAIEALIAAFMSEFCDRDGYAGMQMSQAYLKARGNGDAR